ncbi:MAG: branched chain amino acid aminotransferase [Candidatus Cloacimonetes bacterium 4572_55]|nr:MAG: branched chain amino acid aminotransferase [Candidatus Cloacimonetes bacterium 4572_55]
MEIPIEKTTQSKLSQVDFNNLVFGSTFTDHMFDMEYRDGKWQNPRIIPYGPIQIEPGMSVLHYGQAIFEGSKAFYTKDGRINVFRMNKNFERLNCSAKRLCIPDIEEDVYYTAIKKLILLEKAWVPKDRGTALYIRPFIFASESFLGVRPSKTYRFMVILCPVGPYYAEGFNPVKLSTSGEYGRAFQGGVGNAKAAANYAISLFPANEAKKQGFTQVVWLDAKEHRYVEEVGTMNLFCYLDDTLITPPLDEGTILPGVTRESVIHIARDMGIPVCERKIAIEELFDAAEKGTLKEIFGSGTAAVISPVGELHHKGQTIKINGGKTGELAQKMFDEITGIQYGEKSDTNNWCHYLD